MPSTPNEVQNSRKFVVGNAIIACVLAALLPVFYFIKNAGNNWLTNINFIGR